MVLLTWKCIPWLSCVYLLNLQQTGEKVKKNDGRVRTPDNRSWQRRSSPESLRVSIKGTATTLSLPLFWELRIARKTKMTHARVGVYLIRAKRVSN